MVAGPLVMGPAFDLHEGPDVGQNGLTIDWVIEEGRRGGACVLLSGGYLDSSRRCEN